MYLDEMIDFMNKLFFSSPSAVVLRAFKLVDNVDYTFSFFTFRNIKNCIRLTYFM